MNKAMPTVLAVLGAALVGSLYTTALEGIVDWLHRKMLRFEASEANNAMVRRVHSAISPFSSVSRSRLVVSARRFYDDEAAADCPITREEFENRVLADVLWLEGKLVGTPLKDPHDQYRSEGELRLSTGIILPVCAAALMRAFGAHQAWTWIAVIAGAGAGIWQANYGLYYYRRANSFLAHHIADGKLKTPSMESLPTARRAD
jgi:hypothetical protein